MARYFLKDFEEIARKNKFIFERVGKTYELCSNEKDLGRGVTNVYDSLAEASPDIRDICDGISPLNGARFRYP